MSKGTKIYSGLLAFFAIFSALFLIFRTPQNPINYFLVVYELVFALGVYSYGFSKKLFTPIFWKFVFVLGLLTNVIMLAFGHFGLSETFEHTVFIVRSSGDILISFITTLLGLYFVFTLTAWLPRNKKTDELVGRVFAVVILAFMAYYFLSGMYLSSGFFGG